MSCVVRIGDQVDSLVSERLREQQRGDALKRRHTELGSKKLEVMAEQQSLTAEEQSLLERIEVIRFKMQTNTETIQNIEIEQDQVGRDLEWNKGRVQVLNEAHETILRALEKTKNQIAATNSPLRGAVSSAGQVSVDSDPIPFTQDAEMVSPNNRDNNPQEVVSEAAGEKTGQVSVDSDPIPFTQDAEMVSANHGDANSWKEVTSELVGEKTGQPLVDPASISVAEDGETASSNNNDANSGKEVTSGAVGEKRGEVEEEFSIQMNKRRRRDSESEEDEEAQSVNKENPEPTKDRNSLSAADEEQDALHDLAFMALKESKTPPPETFFKMLPATLNKQEGPGKRTLLFLACRQGLPGAVRQLLSLGADPTLKGQLNLIRRKDSEFMTPFEAAKKGRDKQDKNSKRWNLFNGIMNQLKTPSSKEGDAISQPRTTAASRRVKPIQKEAQKRAETVSKLYKRGDLVGMIADGQIKWKGRIINRTMNGSVVLRKGESEDGLRMSIPITEIIPWVDGVSKIRVLVWYPKIGAYVAGSLSCEGSTYTVQLEDSDKIIDKSKQVSSCEIIPFPSEADLEKIFDLTERQYTHSKEGGTFNYRTYIIKTNGGD